VGVAFVTATLVLTDSVGEAVIDSLGLEGGESAQAVVVPPDTGESEPDNLAPDNLAPDYREDTRADVEAAMNLVRNVLLVFAGVALLVALIVIANTFSLLVAQRVRQIGMLRAIGATGSQVRLGVLVEAVVVGLLGSLTGLGLGIAGAAAVVSFIERPAEGFEIGLVVGFGTVAAALAVGIGATVLSVVAPTLTAGRVSPMAAIRTGGPRRASRRWRLGVGIPLLALGLGLVYAGLFLDGQEAGPVMVELVAGAVVSFVAVALLSVIFAGPAVNLVGRAPGVGALLVTAGAGLAVSRYQMLNGQDSTYFVLNPTKLAWVIFPIALGGQAVNRLAGRARVDAGNLAAGAGLLSLGVVVETGDEYSTGLDLWLIGAVAATVIGLWMLYSSVAGGERSGPVESVAGPAGALARKNAVSAPHRTASMVTSLTIGLALVSAVFTVGQSIKTGVVSALQRTVTADRVLVLEEGIGELDIDTLADIAGVAAVKPVRWEPMQIEGREVAVTIMENPIDTALVDIGAGPQSTAPGADGILVHVTEAERRSIDVGDVVEVGLYSDETRLLTVTGLFERDYHQNRWVIDQEAFDQHVQATMSEWFVTDVVVNIEDGADAAAVDVALREAVDGAGWTVLEPVDLVTEVESMFTIAVAIINGLLGLAVLVALLGVVNTTSLSVIERTKEIGLLRAVGMTGPQVRQSIRWEVVFVCVFGSVLGTGLGIGFGWAAANAVQAHVPSVPVVPIGPASVMLLAALGAGVLAAALPAHRAGRMDLLQAIAGG
jgi:putative ABC transport system permease protein